MIRFLVISILSVMVFFSSWSVASEGHGKSAISQMAEIMHRLKHYPSPQGKSELKAIINAKATTNNESVIATAMLNLEHAVSSKDAPLLQKVVKNSSASKQERELASIILNLDHRPTSQDKSKLKAMMH